MGQVIIQPYTTINPIELVGYEAGVCWGADVSNQQKNMRRGLSCLRSGHMRTAEFPQVYLVLKGYSARVIREFYTHIAGGPTRLQSSTRYIDYNNLDAIAIKSIENNPKAKTAYWNCINTIADTYKFLFEECEIPREDCANVLPLGMTTEVVVRTNLRHLIDMSHLRLCTRAYWEFRELMKDVIKALKEYSEQWAALVDEFFKPKCEVYGFCDEEHCCGRSITKAEHDRKLEE